ncbi:hypothetical protein TAO_1382 [Candidatus Nitrosoglobus terrae]|uniref:Uncharacterized protein n=2 Tax=Candidatus Nitrosoglobus terrae TaxID=1630141 RepID=A0A1Q2SNP9_9GAMM|nr:hypothetical protein TAO_1382 [Candidatus Nitrosoglobus terrae]
MSEQTAVRAENTVKSLSDLSREASIAKLPTDEANAAKSMYYIPSGEFVGDVAKTYKQSLDWLDKDLSDKEI